MKVNKQVIFNPLVYIIYSCIWALSIKNIGRRENFMQYQQRGGGHSEVKHQNKSRRRRRRKKENENTFKRVLLTSSRFEALKKRAK